MSRILVASDDVATCFIVVTGSNGLCCLFKTIHFSNSFTCCSELFSSLAPTGVISLEINGIANQNTTPSGWLAHQPQRPPRASVCLQHSRNQATGTDNKNEAVWPAAPFYNK